MNLSVRLHLLSASCARLMICCQRKISAVDFNDDQNSPMPMMPAMPECPKQYCPQPEMMGGYGGSMEYGGGGGGGSYGGSMEMGGGGGGYRRRR